MRIYLAGPEVFHPEATRRGSLKSALGARYRFTGVYPLDGDMADARHASAWIYAKCLSFMQDADCDVFNFTPFRGKSRALRSEGRPQRRVGSSGMKVAAQRP